MKPSHIVPHLVDMPMSLGQHLAELQRRLIWPVLFFILAFMGCFACQKYLKAWWVNPLYWAIDIVGSEEAAKIGLDPQGTQFHILSAEEAAKAKLPKQPTVIISVAHREEAKLGLDEPEAQISVIGPKIKVRPATSEHAENGQAQSAAELVEADLNILVVSHKRAVALGVERVESRILQALHPSESAMSSVSISFHAALALTIPMLLWHLWQFIAVALKQNERSLAFLFVPLGVIMFYCGGLLGYFFGLPYYYAWLIEWTVSDPTISSQMFRQYEYWDHFQFMTIVFGLLMDIPWLVMVLVRVGMVTADKLASWRRGIIVLNAVICGIVAPPDAVSMLVMMVPVQLLFESGIIASRIMMWRVNIRKAREAQAAALAAEAEAASRAQATPPVEVPPPATDPDGVVIPPVSPPADMPPATDAPHEPVATPPPLPVDEPPPPGIEDLYAVPPTPAKDHTPPPGIEDLYAPPPAPPTDPGDQDREPHP